MTIDNTSIILTKVNEIIETVINPALAQHGGSISVHSFKDGLLYIQMSGGCQGCAMAKMTMRTGIEERLKEHIPEISRVIDITDHNKGENPYYPENQMPYIRKEIRDMLDVDEFFQKRVISGPGELNYVITKIVLQFLKDRATEHSFMQYKDINDAIGALECSKLEIYRRVAAGFEDEKKEKNGDIDTIEALCRDKSTDSN